jgi:hypothetical protein
MKKRAWYWLLLIPFFAELWPPLFNRVDPQWFGVPFFYWYQLAWVVLTSLLIGFVMVMTRERGDV